MLFALETRVENFAQPLNAMTSRAESGFAYRLLNSGTVKTVPQIGGWFVGILHRSHTSTGFSKVKIWREIGIFG
jgi:hypothetical protein